MRMLTTCSCRSERNPSMYMQVQAALNDHEAITFRPRDDGGRSRHEFPAMVCVGLCWGHCSYDDAGGTSLNCQYAHPTVHQL